MAAPLSCRFTQALAHTSSFSHTSIQLRVFSARRLATLRTRAWRPSQAVASLGSTKRTTSSRPPGLQIRPDDRDPHIAPVTSTVLPDKLSPPAYSPPTTGSLSLLPSSWVPYAELIRLDKPTGTYYLFLPCLFSTLLAGTMTAPLASPLDILSTSALFFTGALVMRGAGCTVNDLWDRNLDPHVARTRLRPIARGAISVRQAVPFLGAQLLVGLGVLVSLPTQCLYYGIPSLLLVGLYPLAKRVTYYPQAVLGLTFSWGAIMGFPAMGIDLLANQPALLSAACLYGSCIAWTIVYDMIYAYQDIRDDAKAGIKSIALAQEANAKAFLSTVAAVQIALLYGAGAAAGLGSTFVAGSCGSAAATLGYMIYKVDLRSTADCWWWFKRGAWLTGGGISVGLAGEYATRYYELYKGRDEVVVS